MERKKIYLSLAKLSYFILYFHFSLCLIPSISTFYLHLVVVHVMINYVTLQEQLAYYIVTYPLYTRAVEFAVIGLCLIIICDITFLKVIHVNLDEVWIRFFIRVFQTEFRSQSGRFWMGLNYWNTPFLKRIVS